MSTRPAKFAVVISLVAISTLGYFYYGSTERTSAEIQPKTTAATDVDPLPKETAATSATELPTRRPAPKLFVDVEYPQQAYPRAFVLRENTGHRPGPIAGVLAELRPLAEKGDGHAAYKLYRSLERCAVEIDHAHDLMVRVQKQREERGEIMLDEEKSIAQAESVLSDCKNVDPSTLASRAQWLSEAAEGGDIEAQQVFAMRPEAFFPNSASMFDDPQGVIRYKEKALRYTLDAASRGSIAALEELASYYETGALGQRNPVLALAYLNAYLGLIPSLDYGERVSRIRSQLTPGQIADADAKTRHILEACCK